MSDRAMWKMMHLLYTLPPSRAGLTARELEDVDIDCGPDTISPLVQDGVVAFDGQVYSLTAPSRRILGNCVVANRNWQNDDMWVDDPSAFVIMPFREPWSDTVYRQIIEPAVRDAGVDCIRGDVVPRVGELTRNVWGAILHAGLIIADVSALNANVFYEVGLAHALGKDLFLLKQTDAAVPADFGGAHYYAYDLATPDAAKSMLEREVKAWATNNKTEAVRAIRR